MGLEIVKSNLKRSIIRKTVVIIVLTLIFLAAYTFATGVEQELKDVETKVSTLSGEILKRRREYAQSESNLKEYLAISRLKLPSENGYMLGRDRLKVSLPKVQILKDNYFFKKLNFSLTEIKENTQIRSSIFTVYENDITVEYAGATDEYIFSFINDLKNVFPGYITVKSLTMNRERDITLASATEYVSKSDSSFVAGKMELRWSTLKSKASLTGGAKGGKGR